MFIRDDEDDDRELENGETQDGPEGDEDAAEGQEDETEDDAEAGEETEDVLEAEAEEDKPRSRGEKRFQTLSKAAREANERAARTERELQDLKRQLAAPAQQQQETPEAEAARLSLMTPEERIEYRLDKAQRETAGKMARLEFITQDQNDRAEFLTLAARDQRIGKIASEVETRLSDLRSKGQNVDRTSLAKFIIGEKALAASDKAVKKAKQAAGKRVEAQTTKPGNGKGNVAGGRQKASQSLEDRLTGVSI